MKTQKSKQVVKKAAGIKVKSQLKAGACYKYYCSWDGCNWHEFPDDSFECQDNYGGPASGGG